MAKNNTLVGRPTSLQEFAPIDYDPQDDCAQDSSNEGSDSGDSKEDLAGTEHYITVGKSKLRRREEVALGSDYAGSKISREALEASDNSDLEPYGDSDVESGASSGSQNFADPEIADVEADEEDGDIDSDNAFGESDEEKFNNFTFRGSSKPKDTNGIRKRKFAVDFYSNSNDEKDEDDEIKIEAGAQHSDEDEDMDDDVDVSEQDAEEMDTDDNNESNDSEEQAYQDSNSDELDSEEGDENDDKDRRERAELRKTMSADKKTVVGAISNAATVDVEKGKAIRDQRQAFDALLNVRIRLQKALVATNSMAAAEDKDTDVAQSYEAAEAAAFKLLNTLDAMRQELDQSNSIARPSKKRKHAIDAETLSPAIWERLQESEALAAPHRRAILTRWSAKTQQATLGDKLKKVTQATITDVLDGHLSQKDRLVKRTKMPRSCAPVQAKAKISEDPNIYDDADFYQMLLKELIDQRMMDSTSATLGSAPMAHLTAVKEAKTRKVVDTKASKGRKLRFTVHEKLQNFMPREDRSTWESEAVDRFFGSLLGQRMDLGEEIESENDDDINLGEEALMLFRS